MMIDANAMLMFSLQVCRAEDPGYSERGGAAGEKKHFSM